MARAKTVEINTVTVTPKGLRTIVDAAISAKYPIFIWGPPGVGKSAIVRQAVEAAKREMIDLRAPLLDPVDLRGLPTVDKRTGKTRWATPVFIPTAKDSDAVLFCDELNAAPRMVQASFYQLILDRQIGESKLGDKVAVLGAGNREMDGGVVYQMPTPLASRFHTHVELTVSVEEWAEWAVSNGVCMEVVQYNRMRPDQLHNFDPKSPEHSFPCPRTWVFVSDNMKLGLDDATTFSMIAGCIGKGAATEFDAFRRTAARIQPPQVIIADPEGADVPGDQDPALMYATVGALARAADLSNFDKILRYAARLSAKFDVLLFQDATRINPSLLTMEVTTRWMAAHQELFTSGGTVTV